MGPGSPVLRLCLGDRTGAGETRGDRFLITMVPRFGERCGEASALLAVPLPLPLPLPFALGLVGNLTSLPRFAVAYDTDRAPFSLPPGDAMPPPPPPPPPRARAGPRAEPHPGVCAGWRAGVLVGVAVGVAGPGGCGCGRVYVAR